jgi:hypothetical protein
VVGSTVGPFDVKIFLDELDALAINGIDELLGVLLGFAASQQAAHFFFPGSVEKDTQGVLTASKKMLRSSSHDDGVSGFCDVLNDTFGNF